MVVEPILSSNQYCHRTAARPFLSKRDNSASCGVPAASLNPPCMGKPALRRRPAGGISRARIRRGGVRQAASVGPGPVVADRCGPPRLVRKPGMPLVAGAHAGRSDGRRPGRNGETPFRPLRAGHHRRVRLGGEAVVPRRFFVHLCSSCYTGPAARGNTLHLARCLLSVYVLRCAQVRRGLQARLQSRPTGVGAQAGGATCSESGTTSVSRSFR